MKMIQVEERTLCRAKRIDKGEWVEGYYTYYPEGYKLTVETKHVIRDTRTNPGKLYYVDPETICWNTGCKDKNGNLIWENDIVQELFGNTFAPIKYGSYQSCFDSAKTEHVGFYVDWSVTKEPNMRKDLGYWIHMVDAEIVGNTFDNPELLKVYN